MIDRIRRQLTELSDSEPLYVVGGWIRDTILGRPSRDIDVAVGSDPRKLARRIARRMGGSFVVLDADNGIYRVVLKHDPDIDYIDVSRLKGRTIADDLKARDFTINALAADITSSRFDPRSPLDVTGGVKDLARKVVRRTSAASFTDDPLRLMRAFRFAAQLGFRIEPATRSAIARSAALIKKSAAERVRDELFKTLAAPCSSLWIREMEKTKILGIIFPEIMPMKTSARKFYFHPQGLWQHAIETLISLEDILQNLPSYFPQCAEKMNEHLDETFSPGVTRRQLLKLVALLHDVAKPSCAKRVDNRMRFIGHETKGAEMTEEILRRLKMSNREIRVTRNLIEHHMRPIGLAQSAKITDRAAFRLFRDIDNDVPDLLLLSLSDWHSYKRLKSHKPAVLKHQEGKLRELISRYFAEKEKLVQPPLVNGHVLMQEFGLPPGPIIGVVLKKTREAQLLGEITTREEALCLVRKVLTPLKKRYKIK